MGQPDPKPHTPPSPEKPYEQVRLKPDDAVVRKWKAVSVNGDWLLSGNCPRCNHSCEKAVSEEVMVMAFEAEAPTPVNEGVHVIQCNCSHAHPHRPDNVPAGCGAYWGIRVARAGGSDGGS